MVGERRARRASPRLAAACVAAALAAPATAQDDAGEPAPAPLPDIEVIGVTPLSGAGTPIDRVPYNVQVTASGEFESETRGTVYDFFDTAFAGASAADVQNNPYQKNFTYRGFVAGPLLGESVGIAAFLDGVRINDPFGDVVQADLFPEMAIERLELGNSDPAFGFNALGGALVLRTYDGTSFQGAEATQSFGSFGRLRTTLRTGSEQGPWSAFAAFQRDREAGWRDASPSRLNRFFADVGHEGETAGMHISLSLADTDLIGNGLTPVELYEVDNTANFTTPDRTQNRNLLIAARGDIAVGDSIVIEGNVYFRRLRRHTLNGDEVDAETCDDSGEYVCREGDEDDDDDDDDEAAGDDDDDDNGNGHAARDDDDDDGNGNGNAAENGDGDHDDEDEEDETELVIVDTAGNPLASFMPESGAYGALNTSATLTTAFGAGLQASIDRPLGGMDNLFVIGGGVDIGRTRFRSASEVGELLNSRGVVGRASPRHVGGILKFPDLDDDDELFCDEAGTDAAVVIDGKGYCEDDAAPVRLVAENRYLRAFVSDTLYATDDLTLTGSVAANYATVKLADESLFLGTPSDALDGDHDFFSMNPAVGAAWAIPGLESPVTLYGGFRQGSRAPSPAELSCADPDDPCNLPNAFVADPPLEQVISRTFEAGLRGSLDGPALDWSASAFRATNSDDIVFISAGTGLSSGYFDNVGETRRQGFELSLDGEAGWFDWFVNYAYLEATFQTNFRVFTENHPMAVDDEIPVETGDRIPGIPAHSLGAGFGIEPVDGMRIAPSLVYRSGVYLRGDEGNLAPRTEAYTVANLDASYRVDDWLELFARVENLFDRRYETFGVFGESGCEVPIRELPCPGGRGGITNPRFISPGQPRAAMAGVRILLN